MTTLSSLIPVVVRRAPQFAKAARRNRRYLENKKNNKSQTQISNNSLTNHTLVKIYVRIRLVLCFLRLHMPRRQELLPCSTKHPGHQNTFFGRLHLVALPQLPVVLPRLRGSIRIGRRFHPLLKLCPTQLLQNGPIRALHRWAANTPSDSLGRMHSQHHDSEETEHTRRSSGPSNCPAVAIRADHRGVCRPKKGQILDWPM